MLLQSQEKFDEIAELDPNTGKVSFFSKQKNPRKYSNMSQMRGWYSQLNGHLLLLYTHDGKLFLRVDEDLFELNEDTKVSLERGSSQNVLTILRYDALTYRLEYKPPVIDPPLEEDFISTGVEEEDFDFCLFVHNVVNNPARRALVLQAVA